LRRGIPHINRVIGGAVRSIQNQLFEAPDLLQLIEQMEDGQLID
jgi:hypothetical protein